MQLYAIDQKDKVIFANAAQKQFDYRCMECQKRVRLRGGLHRQNHFFHLDPNNHCRLNGKGMVHLQIQLYLHQLLPKDESQLEYRFNKINRVADVAWMPYKIIFEIQCSPILSDEVKQRNEDYLKLGWQVIWILHDKRYNQLRISAAEQALSTFPHYFTNMDSEGRGIIYDQFESIEQGIRRHKLNPLQINLASFKSLYPQMCHINHLKCVNERLRYWPVYFLGDLVDMNLGKLDYNYLKEAKEIETKLEQKKDSTEKNSYPKHIIELFYQIIIRPYYLLFQIILEKMSR